MTDPQLDLEVVKQQFLDAEQKLADLAAELHSAATARQALERSADAMAATATALADATSAVGSLTEAVSRAAQAIEEADPAALNRRVDSIESLVADNGVRLDGMASMQRQSRLLIAVSTVLLIAIIALVLVSP